MRLVLAQASIEGFDSCVYGWVRDFGHWSAFAFVWARGTPCQDSKESMHRGKEVSQRTLGGI